MARILSRVGASAKPGAIHFKYFDLAKRFSVKAAQLLETTLSQTGEAFERVGK
jgi:hypothetical protein